MAKPGPKGPTSTSFKPGQSGNPLGRAVEPKPFIDAVRRAVAQDNGKRLRQCAEKLLTLASQGEPWAVQMLADRLDGKAPQEVKITREVREMSMDEILTELAQGRLVGRTAGEKAGPDEPGPVH